MDRSQAVALMLALACGPCLAGDAQGGTSYAQAVTDLVVFQTDIGRLAGHRKSGHDTGLDHRGPTSADQVDYFNVSIKVPEGTAPYLTLGWGRLEQAPGWRLTANVGSSAGKGKVTGTAHVSPPGISPAGVDVSAIPNRPEVNKSKAAPQLTLGASYRY
jgi:hypothetical protein